MSGAAGASHELLTLRAPPGPVGLLLRDVPADDDALSALARAGGGHQVYIHSIDPSSPLADLARLRDVIVRVTASVGDAPPTELEARSCSSKQARLSRGPISSRERALL